MPRDQRRGPMSDAEKMAIFQWVSSDRSVAEGRHIVDVCNDAAKQFYPQIDMDTVHGKSLRTTLRKLFKTMNEGMGLDIDFKRRVPEAARCRAVGVGSYWQKVRKAQMASMAYAILNLYQQTGAMIEPETQAQLSAIAMDDKWEWPIS